MEKNTNKQSYQYYILTAKHFIKDDAKRIGESIVIKWTKFDVVVSFDKARKPY